MPVRSGSPSQRLPPIPSPDHAAIAGWTDAAMPALQPVLRALDARIRDALPGLRFPLKWKKAYYGLPAHGWIIELAAYDVSVNLVFFAGARLDPPPPLGEDARYLKLRTVEKARTPQIGRWIGQAGRLPGWRWPGTTG